MLAVARLPHTWTNASGGQVRGLSEVVLCARCDAGDALAGPIVTYFAVHGTLHPGRLAGALRRWAAHARPPVPDTDALRAETDAWYRGDL